MQKGDFIIITNNPVVRERMGGRCAVLFVEGGYRDVLIKVRDMVYTGHTLYTHPLAGSVKPNDTMYRSIAISKKPHEFSMELSEIISNSVAVCDKFPVKQRTLTEKMLRDFQMVDYILIAGAMEFYWAAGLAQ